MMNRKTIMLFCSLMYRIAGEGEKNLFLWIQLTRYKQQCLLFGKYTLRLLCTMC